MKQGFLFIGISLFVFVADSKAQNTSPYWSLAGNSTATPSSKFGTTNKISLRFYTGNLQRMIIDSAKGLVAIGAVPTDTRLLVNSAIGENAFRAQVNGVTKFLVDDGGGVSVGSTTTPPVNGLYVSGSTGIGTSAPKAKLHIKGNSNISQLIVEANKTQSNAQPLVVLRNGVGADLLHIHADDSSNTFIGFKSGRSNVVGTGGDGMYNTFTGSKSGYSNTSGRLNTASGFQSLFSNTTGYDNTATGFQALYSNTTGFANTAFGEAALSSNINGNYNMAIGTSALGINNSGGGNTANGHASLGRNTSGYYNTGNGYGALNGNSVGGYNTGMGAFSLFNTTTSQYNIAVGYTAGYAFNNGYNNVFLGAAADVNGAGYYNVIAIGQGTICTAPSQVTMGNSATNSYRAYNYWSNISDGRYKKNVKENVPGLAFINKLRPVTYNLDATGLDNFMNQGRSKDVEISGEAKAAKDKALDEKSQVIQTGFVAQEVERSAKDMSYDFSGVDAPQNDKDVYGLRYAEFVVPLVKAVQELSVKNDEKDKEIQDLKERLLKLESLVLNNQPLSTTHAGYLKQNVPNPATNSTVISYYLPDNISRGQIIITDAKGSTLKVYNAVKGQGQLNIKHGELPLGTYNYSLYVNDKKVDTKQMVIRK